MNIRRLRRQDVEARAIERGYDIASLERCFVRHLGGGIWEVDIASRSYPAARAGLGDIVAAGLSAVGITKERALAAAKLVGVEDCGCSQHQQQLNELGHWFGIGSPPQPPSA